MKKSLILIVLAALVMGACGNRTGKTAELDSLSLNLPAEQVSPLEQANQVVALLQEQLRNTDQETVKAICAQVAETISNFIESGDEDAATRYAAVINQFMTENALKIQETGIGNTLAEALNSVQGIPAGITELIGQTSVQTDTAVAAVKKAVDELPEAVKKAAKETIKEQSGKLIDEAASAAKKELGL